MEGPGAAAAGLGSAQEVGSGSVAAGSGWEVEVAAGSGWEVEERVGWEEAAAEEGPGAAEAGLGSRAADLEGLEGGLGLDLKEGSDLEEATESDGEVVAGAGSGVAAGSRSPAEGSHSEAAEDWGCSRAAEAGWAALGWQARSSSAETAAGAGWEALEEAAAVGGAEQRPTGVSTVASRAGWRQRPQQASRGAVAAAAAGACLAHPRQRPPAEGAPRRCAAARPWRRSAAQAAAAGEGRPRRVPRRASCRAARVPALPQRPQTGEQGRVTGVWQRRRVSSDGGEARAGQQSAPRAQEAFGSLEGRRRLSPARLQAAARLASQGNHRGNGSLTARECESNARFARARALRACTR